MEQATAYTVCIGTKNRDSRTTWCADYKFDPDKQHVTLYGVTGDVCGIINMQDRDFERLDIYDVHKKTQGPVQTFLPVPEVI